MQVNDLSKTKICLEFGEDALRQPPKGSNWTAEEICQQPGLWREMAEQFVQEKGRLHDFAAPLLAMPDLRVILTGAGTSAYIGEALAPFLATQMPLVGQTVEAIATTDLVSHPHLYLHPARPTLVISFGRSGSSPESMAAIELCDALLPACYHLLLTCNPKGSMARYGEQKADRACLWLMPEGSHDRSFAMTSSFTCMYLGVLLLFAANYSALARAVTLAERLLTDRGDEIARLAASPLSRVVFLGGGALQGIAREAALKLLELSAGAVMGVHESPLGFRHGPKSLIDKDSLVVVLCSSEPYARAYDMDMAAELERDGAASAVVRLCEENIGADGQTLLEDVWLTFPYILYCQLFAYFKALNLGISADNPCPGGQVNRVVQGVKIHPLSQYRLPGTGV